MKVFIFIFLLYSSIQSAHSSSQLKVPVGFESLLNGQIEFIEIQFNGRSLGVQKVLVKPEEVIIQEPTKIATAMNSFGVDLELNELANILSKKLSIHKFECSQDPLASELCNQTAPDSISAVFNEQSSILQLVVPEQWLKTTNSNTSEFYTLSESKNAFIHQQNFVASQFDDYRAISLKGAGALGLGENRHFGFTWNYNNLATKYFSDNAFNLENYYIRQDYNSQYYAQFGRINSNNMFNSESGNFNFSLLPLNTIEGVRIGTTMNYVKENSKMQGSPLAIILKQRARVEVFRNKELLSTLYLDGGFQKIDTSSFPAGNYVVNIRIIEDGKLVRSESLPFTKSSNNRLTDSNLEWFIQAGQSVGDSLDTQGSSPAFQIGVSAPIFQNLRFTTGISFLNDNIFNENRLEYAQWEDTFNWSFANSILTSNNGSIGNTQNISFSSFAHINLYRYFMKNSSENKNQDSYYYNNKSSESLSISSSIPLGRVSFNASHSINKTTRFDSDYRKTDYLNRFPDELFPLKNISSRATQIGISNAFTISTFNLTNSINAFVNKYPRDSRDRGVYVTFSVSHNDRSKSGVNRFTNANFDIRKGSGSTNGLTTNFSRTYMWDGEDGNNEFRLGAGYGSQGEYDTEFMGSIQRDWGRSSFGITQNRYSDQDLLGLSANHSSSFAIGNDGFFWGQSLNQEPVAAVGIISNSIKESDGKVANAYINSGTSTNIRQGEKKLLPIKGFKAATTSVTDPTGKQDSHFIIQSGDGTRDWFLQPGRLGIVNLESRMNYTYVGSLNDLNENPLSATIILNAPQYQTENDGSFVFDLDHKTDRIYAKQNTTFYSCDIGSMTIRKNLIRTGKIICKPSTAFSISTIVHDSKSTISSISN